MYLEPSASQTGWILRSSNPKIKSQRPKISGEELEKLLTTGSPSIHETIVTGLVELCKVKPAGLDAVQWLGEWLIANNPNKPRVDDD